MSFLDISICTDLRDAINSSPIFTEIEEYRKHFNQICAIMDRLQTSVNYLNNHSEHPESEEDFICFMVFACMVYDASKRLFEDVINRDTPTKYDKKYFNEICTKYPLSLSDDECLTDDEFFEYFRSLTFAHPYETSRNKVLKNRFGTQVSPWVIVNNWHDRANNEKSVGVRIYASNGGKGENDTYNILVTFSQLKNFINSRYSSIYQVTQWLKEQIEAKESEWKKNKIDRTKSEKEIFEQIVLILQERFVETYEIEEIQKYLFCESTIKDNNYNIELYRNYIKSKLPKVYDAIDDINYDNLYEITSDILNHYPKNLHEGGDYQLEKIFSYLRDSDDAHIYQSSNVEWGLMQARAFYEQFAHKWVKIDINTMTFAEIRLLVTVACFMEIQNEKNV